MSSSSSTTKTTTPTITTNGGSFLTKYFLIILFLFASVSFLLNVRLSDALVQDVSIIEHHLEESLQSFAKSFQIMTNPQPQDDPQLLLLPPSDAEDGDDDDDGNDKENNSNNKDNNDKDNNDKDNTINPPHAHRVSGLNCDKWGGPSEEDAKEMVYWEDIPSDNQHMSPFHWKKQKTQQPPKQQRSMEQFMTFEPDGGGWNNIRMAMETVLVSIINLPIYLFLARHEESSVPLMSICLCLCFVNPTVMLPGHGLCHGTDVGVATPPKNVFAHQGRKGKATIAIFL